MDRIMYILVVAMLISWLILILYWRYVQAFKAFMKDLNRISCRIQKKDFSVTNYVLTYTDKLMGHSIREWFSPFSKLNSLWNLTVTLEVRVFMFWRRRETSSVGLLGEV